MSNTRIATPYDNPNQAENDLKQFVAVMDFVAKVHNNQLNIDTNIRDKIVEVLLLGIRYRYNWIISQLPNEDIQP